MGLTLGKIVEMLDSKTIKDVSKEIGIAEKKIRTLLKNQGFYWDNSQKSWEFKGDNLEETLMLPISDMKITNKPLASNKNDDDVLQYIQDNISIDDLKRFFELIGKTLESDIDVSYELFKRVNTEIDKKVERTRKAYPISEELQNKIDYFSDKHRIDKQELIELALKDFFKKYDIIK